MRIVEGGLDDARVLDLAQAHARPRGRHVARDRPPGRERGGSPRPRRIGSCGRGAAMNEERGGARSEGPGEGAGEGPGPGEGAGQAPGEGAGQAPGERARAVPPETRREEPSGEPRDESPRRPWWKRPRRLLLVLVLAPVAYWVLCVVGLLYLRVLPPVTTMVQVQRGVERLVAGERPLVAARWRPVERISDHLPRAVVAAEDARFYRHRGFDWEEMRKARREAERRGEPMRGASTLTQQLLKNLYFTTHRNPVRKLYEWSLTPFAELILGKDRIVELYVNVVEFGPGIFGAEAAARHFYDSAATDLGRRQAASLAAVLPDPLDRRPSGMGWYTDIILGRMGQMGW